MMNDTQPSIRPGSFQIPTQEQIIYGLAAGPAVLAEATRLGATRVLLLTGRSLGALPDGPVQQVERSLGARHAGAFAAVCAHSPREDVIAAAAMARKAGADLLVAVGGGSVIDAAKAAQLCPWHGLETVEAMEPYRSGASAEIARSIAPRLDAVRMVSVSTTLSAPDFTAMAGITDASIRSKQMFMHRLMVPRTAVLDPTATLHTSDDLLYSTAIRSVDHAVECYCSPMASPATEALCLHGLSLLTQALRAMRRDGQDLAARMKAQFGMWQACTALASGVQTGASHGIGYVLGGGFGVGHGETSCVMLPAVLRWNAAVNSQRQQALSTAMGEPGRPAHELLAELIAHLGQPTNLRAVGLREDQLDTVARHAITLPQIAANPRPIKDTAAVREILELAW